MIFDASNLPSRTLPYPVKNFTLEPFRPRQLTLLSKSVRFNDMQPAIDAIGQRLTNIDVMDLTVGDFFYIFTWLRINSLPRNPVTAYWDCVGTMFREQNGERTFTEDQIVLLTENWKNADDAAKQMLDDPTKLLLDGYVCGHANYQKLEFDDFELIMLDEDQKLDPRLDYPRVRTLAEYERLRNDPDYGMMANAVQWIRGPQTLNERIEMLFDQEDMELFELASEAARDIDHGIRQVVTKHCSVCNTPHTMRFVVDAGSFFE